ncbi:hypothetical protein RhiirC2_791479 [Rhizophagus irregularis]|uniref:DUF8211 domain-containing protein n=1 Tax=Rhizophagus irregularis TaxID=588596 RepID=A0A2N1MJ54_9GLOM|nr:hypothetical protein RhiirC2_791479 [Rhizophagus irregularis]
MSDNRHECGLHFFRKYPAAIAFVRNEHGDLIPKNQRRNKQFHANLTFDRWITKESKSISSSRTGISYNSRYIVCNSNRKLRPGRTHIYHKLMDNFQLSPSPNPRTAKKQQIRFERSCRRILSQEKTADIPKQKDYNFTIPHYFNTNTNTGTRPKALRNISVATAMTSASVPNNENLYTVAPYNPVPDMFIPIKYRDIIPPDPIYDNSGSFIIPGSRAWFTYMHQLDLDTRDDRLEKANDATFATKMDRLYAEGEASKARYQQQRQVSESTEWNNVCHTYMQSVKRPTLTKNQKKYQKQKMKKKKILEPEIDSFFINYPNVEPPLSLKPKKFTRSWFDYQGRTFPSDPNTSDDTKELEIRPLKRNNHIFNHNSSSNSIHKRSRLDTPLALDSEQAGSSK